MQDNGRENGNYTDYRDYTEIMKDNGKENGNYTDYRDYTGVI